MLPVMLLLFKFFMPEAFFRTAIVVVVIGVVEVSLPLAFDVDGEESDAFLDISFALIIVAALFVTFPGTDDAADDAAAAEPVALWPIAAADDTADDVLAADDEATVTASLGSLSSCKQLCVCLVTC